jgi:hypothetical protein
MSYKSDLEDHYKRVRERMRMGVKSPVIPRSLMAAAQPPGGIAGGTGLAPPLVAMAEPERVISKEESDNRRDGQLNSEILQGRLEEEAKALPRLMPLPGFDYEDKYSLWKRLVAAVANRYDLSVEEVFGPKRARNIVDARFECMYRMRTELCMSYLSIATKIGRDHSTIIHGVNTIRDRLLDGRMKQMQSATVPAYGMVPKQGTHTQLVAA